MARRCITPDVDVHTIRRKITSVALEGAISHNLARCVFQMRMVVNGRMMRGGGAMVRLNDRVRNGEEGYYQTGSESLRFTNLGS